MLTDAETVIMPSLKGPGRGRGTTGGGHQGNIAPGTPNGPLSSDGPAERAAAGQPPMTPIRSGAEFAKADGQVLPTVQGPPEVSPHAVTVPAQKLRKQDKQDKQDERSRGGAAGVPAAGAVHPGGRAPP